MTSSVTAMAEQPIGDQLRASLHARLGVEAGTTWGQFKAAMDRLYVRDEDVLSMVEFGISQAGNGRLVREDDDHGQVEIREGVRS